MAPLAGNERWGHFRQHSSAFRTTAKSQPEIIFEANDDEAKLREETIIDEGTKLN
jgi:hypothetical protein